jgi:hypothetical protein
MVNIMGLKLDIDASLSIDENGVKVKVKGFNTNNFIIDKVFNKLSKKKKNDKKKNKDKSSYLDFDKECVNNSVDSIEVEGPIVIDVTV